MSQEVKLNAYKVQELFPVRRGTEIHCLEGMLWITQDGDLADHVIGGGEKFIVDRKGKVVLQALNTSSTFSLN
jgi:hypothetical protein